MLLLALNGSLQARLTDLHELCFTGLQAAMNCMQQVQPQQHLQHSQDGSAGTQATLACTLAAVHGSHALYLSSGGGIQGSQPKGKVAPTAEDAWPDGRELDTHICSCWQLGRAILHYTTLCRALTSTHRLLLVAGEGEASSTHIVVCCLPAPLRK